LVKEPILQINQLTYRIATPPLSTASPMVRTQTCAPEIYSILQHEFIYSCSALILLLLFFLQAQSIMGATQKRQGLVSAIFSLCIHNLPHKSGIFSAPVYV
jgi:hypothetical protein